MTLFPHLRVRSHYSMGSGLADEKQLAAAAAQRGIPALGLMDDTSMFGTVKFYQAAMRQGVQPIVGVDLPLLGAPGFDGKGLARVGLLARNRQGYLNLLALVSHAHLECGERAPHVPWDFLRGHADGLVALSGAMAAEPLAAFEGRHTETVHACVVPPGERRGGLDAALAAVERWRELFGEDFCLEVQRLGRPGEDRALATAVELSQKSGAPLVATNDVCFLDADDWERHEARVCVAQGLQLADEGRRSPYVRGQHLADAETMRRLFADLPAAVDNALAIARRCGATVPLHEGPHTPEFVTENGASLPDYLREQSQRGLCRRLGLDPESGELPAQYRERLDYEVGVVCEMGFAGYFLIVMEFVGWARDQGIPVGPGRGSGAGSLIAWALRITDVDPIVHGLLFERFLNPQRVSMPDFDIDFCPKGRDRVIQHVVERYGREAVAQIAALGTMAARAAIKDAARVQGHPAVVGDRMASQVPEELEITLEKARQDSPALAEMLEGDEEADIFHLALGLEGRARNVARHAGGVVIAPGALQGHAPLYRDPQSGAIMTQYDKKDLETVGLIKFDFLGLTTLTVIQESLQTLNAQRQAQGQEPVDFDAMDTDDQQVYQSLQVGACTGVFQLESDHMRTRVQDFAACSLEELSALGAVIRPGPLQSGMYDQALEVKRGNREMEVPHPDLHDALSETWGVFLYQEQVMEAVRVLAGYSYAEADELRRAMGDKNPATMERHRPGFCERTADRMPREQAEGIFDTIANFAGYGFNKSHSLAYAVLSYRTAWLKHHYPSHYFAAALNADANNPKRIEKLIREMQRLELQVLPPDVNRSGVESAHVEAEGQRGVRLGLELVKSLGRQAAQGIVEGRDSGGDFADLFDFCRRSRAHGFGERAVQALVGAGALDALVSTRHAGWQAAPSAVQASEQHWAERDSGQGGLFGDADGDAGGDSAAAAVPHRPEWPQDLMIDRERDALGFHLRLHPVEIYGSDFEQLGCVPADEGLVKAEESRVIGLVRFVERRLRTRGGNPMTVHMFGLDCGGGDLVRAEYSGDNAEQFRNLRPGTVVCANLVRPRHWRNGEVKGPRVWDLGRVTDMREMRRNGASSLRVRVSGEAGLGEIRQLLQKAVAAGPGCGLVVSLEDEDLRILGDLELADGRNRSIQADSNLRECLHTLPAVVSASYEYNA